MRKERNRPHFFLTIVFIAPIVAILLTGLISVVVDGVFTLVSVFLMLGSFLIIIFHEQIFGSDQEHYDPIPDGALGSFASVALMFTALIIAFFAVKPFAFVARTQSAYPELELFAASSDLAAVPGPIRDSLLLVGVVLLVVAPVAGLLFYGFTRRRRILGKIAISVSIALVISALVFLLTRTSDAGVGLGGLLIRVNTLVCIYAVIFFFAGLVTVGFYLIWRCAPQRVLDGLTASHGVTAFGLPVGVSLADVVTMAQGYSGLKEHYAFMGAIATIGGFLSVLSILAILAFGVVFMFRGFQRGALSHNLFSIACALLIGCIVLAALAEAGGLLYSTTNGFVAPDGSS